MEQTNKNLLKANCNALHIWNELINKLVLEWTDRWMHTYQAF